MDSSKINVLRASLGSIAISELQNAYYTSGLSLAELREDYDLPSDFPTLISSLYSVCLKLTRYAPSALSIFMPLMLVGVFMVQG